MRVEICIESGITSVAKPKDGYVGFIMRQNRQEKVVIGTVKAVNDKYSHLLCLKNALTRISTVYDEILIHTSSEFMYFNLVSTNFTIWEQNSWKNSKGEKINHAEDWKIVADCLKGKKMTIKLNENYKGKDYLKRAIREKTKNMKIAPVQANG